MGQFLNNTVNQFYCPVVLLTGGSSGIGKDTAQELARAGYTVYAVSRHSAEEEQAVGDNGGRIIYRHMDVTDEDSIRRVVDSIPELGIVIHCAGFGVAGSCEQIPLERVRAQLETNYFGVLMVNQIALPRLRENAHSLVVVVSSVAGFLGIPYQSHYSSSKYALEAYVEALRMEGRQFGIQATLVEPGDTKTEFTAARTHDEPQDSPYFNSCEQAVAQMARDEENGVPASKVTKVIMNVVSKRHPPIRRVVGWDYTLVYWLKRLLPSRTMEWALSRIYLK